MDVSKSKKGVLGDSLDLRKKLLSLNFLILILLQNSIIFIIITSYPPIQNEYGLTNTELGFIATLYYICIFIGSLLWTYLFDKYSRRRILLIGGIFWLMGLTLISLNNQYWEILVSIILIGFGCEGVYIISINTYNDIISTQNRSRGISLLYIIQGSGAIFAILVAGIIEGQYSISWKTVISIIAVLSSIFVLSCIILMSGFSKSPSFKNIDNKVDEYIDNLDESVNIIENKRNELYLNQGDEEKGTLQNVSELTDISFISLNKKLTKDLIKEVFRNKSNIFLYLALMIIIPINHFNNIWLQKYWIEIHHISQEMAAISITFTSGGEFLGLVIAGWLLDKRFSGNNIKIKNNIYQYNKPKLGLYSLLSSIPFFTIGYFINWTIPSVEPGTMNFIQLIFYMLRMALNNFSSIGLSYATLFIGFILEQFMGPLFLTILLDCNTQKTRSLSVNVYVILVNLGWLIGPILGGYIADQYDFKVLFMTIPIGLLVTSIIFYFIQKYAKYEYTNVRKAESK
ncbi:MAG: MFS transporter [Promethearchaeota archaeon]